MTPATGKITKAQLLQAKASGKRVYVTAASKPGSWLPADETEINKRHGSPGLLWKIKE